MEAKHLGAEINRAGTAKKTILLVDDEVDLTETLADILNHSGYHVLTANDGVEALQKLKQVTPDLIILDINMPKMGGLPFYQKIADFEKGKTLFPVLILTARVDLDDLFKDLMIDGFMTKPFKLDVFLEEVERILQKNHPDYKLPEEKSESSPKWETANPDGPKGSQKTRPHASKYVLVVEDHPERFNDLVTHLAGQGHSVRAVKSGIDALALAVDEPFNYVFISLNLHDLPGDVVAVKLRQLPSLRQATVYIYAPAEAVANTDATAKICEKTGARLLLLRRGAADLIEAMGGGNTEPGAHAA